jgi:hypothetical protein
MSEDFGNLQYDEGDGFAVMAYAIIDDYQGVDATVADVRRAANTMSEDMLAGKYDWLIGPTYKTGGGAVTWDPEWGGWGRDHCDTFYEDAPSAISFDSHGNPISLTVLADGVADGMYRILPGE